MRAAHIHQVNAKAFEAVTLSGMRNLGSCLGLSAGQVASMCQHFENGFRDLTSPLPTGALDGISQTRLNVAEVSDNRGPASVPDARGTSSQFLA